MYIVRHVENINDNRNGLEKLTFTDTSKKHRCPSYEALDDAIALRDVAVRQAERHGVDLHQLLEPFVVECDLFDTMSQEKSLRLSRHHVG